MTKFDAFAYDEYKDYLIYKELLERETDPELKKVLTEIVGHQFEHYGFWETLSTKKEFVIPPYKIWFFRMIRKVLGLTFTLRFLERDEREAIKRYKELLATTKEPPIKERLKKIIYHEEYHEKRLIGEIKEEKVEFISSIILGLNDGLIELMGALVGFSFAFNNHTVVALTGLITGVAASLSMASSAYMQARHETGKDARKSGIYTGVSYIIVVLLLVAPFFFISSSFIAMAVMFFIALFIISSISYYTAIIFERNFTNQFGEMLLFSIGVTLITFLIGSFFRQWIGS